jgi:hypothetical protein
MIDDATSRILARFYTEGTVQTHMDLLGRWLRHYGRPLVLYTDRRRPWTMAASPPACSRRRHRLPVPARRSFGWAWPNRSGEEDEPALGKAPAA